MFVCFLIQKSGGGSLEAVSDSSHAAIPVPINFNVVGNLLGIDVFRPKGKRIGKDLETRQILSKTRIWAVKT